MYSISAWKSGDSAWRFPREQNAQSPVIAIDIRSPYPLGDQWALNRMHEI